jgi:hypothetical protein
MDSDSEKETLTPEGFVPLFHDPDLPASFFLGKMLEGFQGMFRVWLTSDEGRNVVRESIEPYVQLVIDVSVERLRAEMTEQVELSVQNSDIANHRNELEGIMRDGFQGADFDRAVQGVLATESLDEYIDTDNIEGIAQDAAREAATEVIENATYTVEVSV